VNFSIGTQKVLVFLLVGWLVVSRIMSSTGLVVFSLSGQVVHREEVQLAGPVRGKREVYIHLASST
jgi:hypothetical protein